MARRRSLGRRRKLQVQAIANAATRAAINYGVRAYARGGVRGVQKLAAGAIAAGAGTSAALGAAGYAAVQRATTKGVKRVGSVSDKYSKRRKGNKRSSYTSKRSYGGYRRNSGSVYGRRSTPMLSMVKSSMPKRILRFQGLTRQDTITTSTIGGVDFGQHSGWFTLPCNVMTAAGDASLPIMVFDLNTTPNAAAAQGPVCYRLLLKSTGEPRWDSYAGLDNTDTQSTNWTMEYCNIYGANAQSSHYISPSWYDCRLTMYGASQQHTVFYVEYVQCSAYHSPVDCMAQFFASDPTDAQPILSRMKDQLSHYWQLKAKNLVGNQITPAMPTGRRRTPKLYRVLKRWKYSIKPKETTDSDQTPNSVTAKLFIRDGRVLSYAWALHNAFYDPTNASLTDGRDDRLIKPNVFDAQLGTQVNAQAWPYPTRRRYLVVRAVNTTNTPLITQSYTDTPSFDLVIRKKEVMQQRTSTLG